MFFFQSSFCYSLRCFLEVTIPKWLNGGLPCPRGILSVLVDQAFQLPAAGFRTAAVQATLGATQALPWGSSGGGGGGGEEADSLGNRRI